MNKEVIRELKNIRNSIDALIEKLNEPEKEYIREDQPQKKTPIPVFDNSSNGYKSYDDPTNFPMY